MKSYLQAFIFAAQFLTRIPLHASVTPTEASARKALSLFPLIGVLIGLVLWLVYYLLYAAGSFSPFTAAIAVILTETLITGAFHLDGLADTFDALLSPGTSRDEKLTIMKDSRIGVMGATALIIALLAKAALIKDVISGGSGRALILYPVAGRWCQVALYGTAAYIRAGGIGSLFSRAAGTASLAAGSCLFLASQLVFFCPAALILCVISAFIIRSYMCRSLGGITGDVLGAATVLAEIVFLAGCALSVPA